MKILEAIINTFSFISFFLICIIFLYGVFNGILYLTCLSSEGTPYWNKAVLACHFDYPESTISQTIITDSTCFKNGNKINCSEIVVQ
jgi:hypothetical protein